MFSSSKTAEAKTRIRAIETSIRFDYRPIATSHVKSIWYFVWFSDTAAPIMQHILQFHFNCAQMIEFIRVGRILKKLTTRLIYCRSLFFWIMLICVWSWIQTRVANKHHFATFRIRQYSSLNVEGIFLGSYFKICVQKLSVKWETMNCHCSVRASGVQMSIIIFMELDITPKIAIHV